MGKNKIEEAAKRIEDTKINEKIERINEVGKNLSGIERKFEDAKINEKLDRINEVGKYINEVEKKVKNLLIEVKRKDKEPTKNADKINELEKYISRTLEAFDGVRKNNNILVKKLDIQMAEISESKKRVEEIENKKIPEIKDYLNKLNQRTSEFIDIETANKIVKTIEEYYKEIGKNKDKIKDIEDITKQVSEEINKLLRISPEIDEKISQIDKFSEIPPKIEKIKRIIEKQNLVISDLINGMERLLNVLPFIEDKETLREYSEEMKRIIGKMRDSGYWNEQKEKFMNDLLKTSKRMIRPINEDEIMDKIGKLTNWVSKITNETKVDKEVEKQIKHDIENIKESLGKKVDSKDVQDIYLVEREIIGLTEKFNKLKSVVEKQNFVINDLIMKLQEGEVEGINKKSVKDLQMTVRFYQILNMLPYIIEPTRVNNYLLELKDIIRELKSDKKWNDEKEMFMKNFLSSLSDNYKSRGYEKIGAAYIEGLN